MFVYTYIYISVMVRMFANGPGRPGFNPRSSHTKLSKMVLDSALLNPQDCKVRIEVKCRHPGKGLTPSPTPLWGSY